VISLLLAMTLGPSAHDCTGCALADGRRAFLRDAARSAVGALLALGVAPRLAAALPVEWISAQGASGTHKRYPIPTRDGVQVDKESEVIVARVGNAVYAFSLSCPHQRTALRWQEKEGRFQCPKHKSKYRPDGAYISGRATRSMDRFAVERDGQQLVVDIALLFREDEHRARWQGAVVML